MKNAILKSIVLISCIILASCSSNSPESSALNFMKSFSNGDFETAKEYATTDTKSMLSMLESFGGKDQLEDMSLGKNSKFKITNTEINGDSAICTIQVKDADGEVEDLPINLVKKDGEWLVDMNKEDMGKEEGMEDLDKEEGNPAMGLDSEN
jgi:hypothetical protein